MRKTFRRKKPEENDKKIFAYNENIRKPELLVIDEQGQCLGVINTRDALNTAMERGFDLVEVSPQANPPVARFIDFGKFKYQQEKQAQKQKLKQKKTETKNIRLSFRIGEHDKELRLKQAKEFLADGDKIKVELVLRGRENQHTEKARNYLHEFSLALQENQDLIVEQDMMKQGGRLSIVLAPKNKL